MPDCALSALFARDGGEVSFTLDSSGSALCLRASDSEASVEQALAHHDQPETPRTFHATDVPVASPPTGVMN
eukprot:2261034-Pleurochrysis_carterae.AAC.1